MNAITASTIADTAAAVSVEIDDLNADPNLTSITLTDPGIPALNLTFAQVASDTMALAAIAGPYKIVISDTIANFFLHSSVTDQTNVTSFTIVDTAENIANNIGVFNYYNYDASKFVGIVTTDGTAWSSIDSVSVADYLANQAALDARGNVRIADTAANIAANFSAFENDYNISWIALTDDGVLTLTASQIADNSWTEGRLVRSGLTVSIVDSASDIAENFYNLNALGPATITLTDPGVPALTLSAYQLAYYGSVLSEITNANYTVSVVDNAVDVASAIDMLAGISSVSSVTFTDSDAPILVLSAAQVVNDAAFLAKITNADYSIVVEDDAAGVLANEAALAANPYVTSIQVTDSATNVTANEATLDADPQVTSITVTDNVANVLATAAQLQADPKVTSIQVIDSALNVAANAAALNADPQINSIGVTDTTANILASLETLNTVNGLTSVDSTDSAPIDVTAAQYFAAANVLGVYDGEVLVQDSAANILADLSAFEALPRSPVLEISDSASNVVAAATTITNSSIINRVTVTDTAANVSADYDQLNGLSWRLNSVHLTDGGTPTLMLTCAELFNDYNMHAALQGSYQVQIVDTVANFNSYLSYINSNASYYHLTSVVIDDTSTNIAANFQALKYQSIITGYETTDGLPWYGATALTVSEYLANRSSYDAAGHVHIADTAANIAANFDQLNDWSISLIAITDADTLTLTAQQLSQDWIAVAQIANPRVALAIVDTAADVSAYFNSLQDVASITLTDAGSPNLTLSAFQAAYYPSVFAKITNADFAVTVSDTASDVSSALDALNAATHVATIALTDAGLPTLTLTAAKAVGDSLALGKIAGPFAIAVNDSAANVVANAQAMLAIPQISAINVSDNVANALLYAATLDADPQVKTTSVTDSVANILGAESQLQADTGITSLNVVDSAANIAANVAALNADAQITSITVTDGNYINLGPYLDALNGLTALTAIEPVSYPQTQITVAQALNDTRVIAALERGGSWNSTIIADTVANILPNLGTIEPIAQALHGSFGVADTVANVLANYSTILDAGVYDIQAVDTAANVAANFAELNSQFYINFISIVDTAANVAGVIDELANYDSNAHANLIVTLTDPGTPVLKLTAAQALNDEWFLLNRVPGAFQVQVEDTAANVLANIGALQRDYQVTSIIVVDTPANIAANQAAFSGISLITGYEQTTTVANFLANQASLDAVGGIAIQDAAANVATSFDRLNADANIAAVDLTDAGTPVLTLTAAQAVDGAAFLQKFSSQEYAIDVVDSAADIARNFDALNAQLNVKSIAVSDGAPVNLTMTQLAADVRATSELNGANVVVTDDSGDRTVTTGPATYAISYAGGDGNLTLNDAAGSVALSLTDLNLDQVAIANPWSGGWWPSIETNQLDITILSTGKTISFSNVANIASIQFADGTVIGATELANSAWYWSGTGTNVSTQTQNGPAVLTAGTGADTLVGGTGPDLFLYSAADGDTLIQDDQSAPTTLANVLKLDDLTPQQVSVSYIGANLVMTVNATGHTVTVANEFLSSSHNGVQQIQFADGTVWDWAQIKQAANVVLPPPTARTGSLTVGHGTTVDVTNSLDNFVTAQVSGDVVTITGVSAGKGAISLNNGDAIYTAPTSGGDVINYQTTDNFGYVTNNSVTVTVDPGPTVITGSLTAGSDATINITNLLHSLIAPGLTGDSETLTNVTATNGSISLANGQFLYTAPETGVDSISFGVTDPHGDTASGSVAVTVVPSPNLVVASVTPPATAFSGQQTQVSWTVENSGAGSTSSSGWTDQVYLSFSPVLEDSNGFNGINPNNDYLLATVQNPSYLAPGQSYTNTVTVTIPQNISGPYYFIVVPDSGNALAESSTAVSRAVTSSAFPIDLTPAANLVVTSVQGPAQAFSNQAMELSWTVANEGTGATNVGAWTDEIYASTDGQLDSTAVALGTVSSNGASDYTFLEGEENSGVGLLEEAASGGGSGSSGGGSSGGGIVGGSVGVVAPTNAVLAAGASYTNTTFVTLPNNLSGNITFFVVADANNQINQGVVHGVHSGDTQLQVNLTPEPDLAVTHISAPSQLAGGQEYSFSYTVANNGAGMTGGEAGLQSWVDLYYLSTKPTLDSSAIYLGSQGESGVLGSGQSYGQTVNFTAPTGLNGGYYIIVDANAYGLGNDLTVAPTGPGYLPGSGFAIGVASGGGGGGGGLALVSLMPSTPEEHNYDNNVVGSSAVAVTSIPPQLEVSNVRTAANVLGGHQLAVSWQETDASAGGTAANANWSDEIIMSASGVLGAADNIIVDTISEKRTLAAGSSFIQEADVNIPAYLSGNSTLFVVADATDALASETDNASSGVPIAITGNAAALDVVSVTSSSSVAGGGVVTVSWRVQNNGAGVTGAAYWYDNVYLSSTPTVSPDAIELGQVEHVNPLGVGGSYTASANFTLPVTLAAGTYYFIVQADGNQQVPQLTRTDNVAASSAVALSADANPNGGLDDLTATNVSAPGETLSGQNMSVSWTVQNNSGIAQTAGYDLVYLSRTPVLDPSQDVYLGSTAQAALPVGGTQSFNQSFAIPTGLSGPFYVLVAPADETAQAQNIGVSSLIQVDLPPQGDSASLPDLAVASVNPPANATVGAPITISYSVDDLSSGGAEGNWTDAVYLSTSPEWTSSAMLIGNVQRTGSVAGGGSYTGTLSSTVPGLTPGNYYVIVRTDIRDSVPQNIQSNNTGVSVGTVAVSLPSLNVGTPFTGALSSGQTIYYQFNATAGETINLSLATDDPGSINNIYVQYGAVPTLANFEAVSKSQTVANPSTSFQATQTGTYYVMVTGNSVPGALGSGSENYTLNVDSIPYSITSIGSDYGSNEGNATLTINGAQFTAGATAELISSTGEVRQATNVQYASDTKMFATFDLQGLATGSYSVEIQQGAQSATLANAYTVTDGPVGQLSVSLTCSPDVLAGETGVVQVNYSNTGQTDISAPVLKLSSDGTLIFPQGQTTASSDDSATINFLATSQNGEAGVLAPGEQGTATFIFQPTSTAAHAPFSFTVSTMDPGGTLEASAGDLISSGLSSAQVEYLFSPAVENQLRPGGIDTTDWNNIWKNLASISGNTAGSLDAALSQTATELALVGQPTTDVATLLSDEFLEAAGGLTLSPLNVATDIAPFGALDNVSLTRTYESSLFNRNRVGLFGVGWNSDYDVSVAVSSDGTVIVAGPNGYQAFTPEGQGVFAAQSGDPAGDTLTFTNGLYRLTNASGDVYSFSPSGQLGSIAHASGSTTTLTRAANGTLQSVADSNGDSISFATNAAGCVTSATASNGQTVTYTYDSSGKELLSASGPGGVTIYNYKTDDGTPQANALSQIVNSDGTIENFTYNSMGALASQSGANGADAITYSYPSSNEVIETNALGQSTTYLYDANGQVAELQDARGNVTRYETSANGKLIQVTTPSGEAYDFSYDSAGNITGYTDPQGNQVTATYAPGTNELTGFTNQNGARTQYVENSSGQVTGIVYQDGSGASFDYSTSGLLTSSKDAAGNTTTYAYNSASELTKETFADGTSQSYAYNAAGDLTSATATNGEVTTYTYNSANELTSATDIQGRSLSYAWNSNGQLSQLTYSDGTVTDYGYNPAGLLSSVTDGSGNLIENYTYNAVDQLTGEAKGNGTSTQYSYNADGEITQILNLNADGSTASDYVYNYNASGQVVGVQTSDGMWAYGYNADGELTAADFASTNSTIQSQTNSFQYDAAGNKVSSTNNGVVTRNSYNALNQLISSSSPGGVTTYAYNADGDMITATSAGGVTTYSYNDANKLVSVSSPSGVTSYQYDALGNVVATTVNGVTTEDVVNLLALDSSATGPLAALAQAYDSSGNVTGTYIYGGTGLTASNGPSGTDYYDIDLTDNVTGVSGANGNLAASYDYTPFGSLLSSTGGLSNPYQFQGGIGQVTTGSGLVDMRARYYDTALGRFVQQDPTGIAGGLNLYEYANEDPIRFTDRTGLAPEAFPFQNNFPNGDVSGAAAQSQAQELMRPYNDFMNGLRDAMAPGLSTAALSIALNLPRGNVMGALRGAATGLGRAAFDGLHYAQGHQPGQTVDPGDPNDIEGPAGFGPQNFVAAASTNLYTVNFQNETTASAPAQTVTVTEQLDSNLNWSTFRIVGFGFKQQSYVLNGNQAFYSGLINLSATDGYDVAVTAGVNLANGVVTWTFTTIDPATGETPTNPEVGFLPVDNGTGIGDGFVSYSIQANSNVQTGTTVGAQATVLFNNQPPLATAEITNAIDASTPVSSVTALPSLNANTQFEVEWSGTDDPQSSGIASYTIMVSVNGGPATAWLTDTTQTNAIFTGQDGNTYSFSSIATSNAGNVEAQHASPDTTIEVGTVAPTGLVLTAASDSGAPQNPDITNVATPTVTGHAEAGATVTLYDGSNIAGTAVADAVTGAWSVTSAPLTDGAHELTATAVNSTGVVSPNSAALAVTIDTTLPVVTISNIAGTVTQASQTIAGTVVDADAGTSVTVLDGGVAVATARVAADGSWSTNVTLANGANSITATDTDLAGNIGASNAVALTLQTTTDVTVAVAIDSNDVNIANPTGLVTFTFSEAPTAFTLADTNAVGGTLSNLSGSGVSYTAVFTAAAGTDINNASVSVTAGSWQDANGNAGTGASTSPFTVDTVTPMVAVAIGSTDVNVTNPSSLVTFTFSQAPTAFTLADTSAVGGTLSNLSGSGASYSATFTAAAGTDINNASISVTAGSWQNANGNAGAGVSTSPFTVDTVTPTVAVAIGSADVNVTNPSSLVTFTFSEAPTAFTLADTSAVGGALSNLSGSGASYSATFTAAAGTDIDNATVSVNAGSWQEVNGNAGTGASTSLFTVDTVTPTVSSIVASPATGDKNAGNTILLTLTLSQNVVVTGTPALTLNDGGTAIYQSGSGSNVLQFAYTVANAQNTSALAVTGNNLNGSSIAIADTDGNAADLTGADVSFPGLAVGATVQFVTSTPFSGDLGPGKVITFAVTMTEAVIVTGGTPTLSLSDGGTATYKSGSGSNVLNFTYTVGALGSGQNAAALAVTGFNANGATVYDSGILADTANLGGVTSFATGPQVDTTAPAVSSVVANPASADLGASSTVTLTVDFSENVAVTGSPYLTLNDGGKATYVSGSGSNALTFTYTVAAGQNTSDLTVTGLSANGGTIRDGVGNNAILSGAVRNPAGTLQIDTKAPSVTEKLVSDTGVSKADLITSADEVSGGGDPNAVVQFTVDGIAIAATATASSTGAWTFTPTGLADGTHTIVASETDGAGNTGTASLTLTLDTTAPTVTSVATNPSNGDLDAGNTVTLTVDFSAAVYATATSYLQLNDGGKATYVSGSGSNALTFSYTVAAGQNTSTLAVTALSSGLTDVAGNVALVAGAVTNPGGVLQIDTSAPKISSITTSGAGIAAGKGDLDAGNTVTLTVNFSENVLVNTTGGSPTLALNDGGIATYSGGSASSALTFSYTVAAGQNVADLAMAATSALSLNGASITDDAGNVAVLAAANGYNPVGTLQIDTASPTVTKVVASPGSGEVVTGHAVTITLDTSEAVTVTGTPELLLNDGATASYDATKSSAKAMVFDYAVAAGDVSTDLAVSGIELPSSSAITDLAGNNATLSGAAANLGVHINTTSTGVAGPGAGSFTITGNSDIELFGASAANLTLASGSTGTLKLYASSQFTGTVAGLALGNYLDLSDVAYQGNSSPIYSASGANTGTLSVTQGASTINVALLGSYFASSFVASSDGHGGTLVTDPPLPVQGMLTQPQHA